MPWRILLPIRGAGLGKSRLVDDGRSVAEHRALVHALQIDTVTAVLAAREQRPELLAGCYLVGPAQTAAEFPPGIEVLADPGTGLNDALSAAGQLLTARYPGDAVLAMVADLPSLRAADLIGVLHLAAGAHSFVPDRSGDGTTMLAAAPGTALDPRFGEGSAAAHRRTGARELAAPVRARADVDTDDDLRTCLALGVGTRTAAVIAGLQPFT